MWIEVKVVWLLLKEFKRIIIVEKCTLNQSNEKFWNFFCDKWYEK